MNNTHDSNYGAIIGALGLPALLLTSPIGGELAILTLHHIDENCSMAFLVIPLAALILAITGAIAGAIVGASTKQAVDVRQFLFWIGVASAILTVGGFVGEYATYKPAPYSAHCYI